MMKNKEIMPEAIRLIVFDWDGTLMDSETQIVHSMFGAIRDMQLESRTADECRNIIGLGLKEAIDSLYPGRDEQFSRQFVDSYRHHWFTQAHDSELFPGARETLLLLREAGFELAIATGKGRTGLERVLKHTELESMFSVTRCSDETRSKPHPQMLEEILQETGVEAENTLMVGDTEYDMNMAIQAGVHPVAVSYGVHERGRLMAHQPLTCLDTISELVDWLAEQQLLDPEFIIQPSLLAAD